MKGSIAVTHFLLYIYRMKYGLNPFALIVKNISDYIIAITCLIILSPLILFLLLLIRISSKGPAIFMQIRIGKNGKPFKLYKFRSMRTGNGDDISVLAEKNDTRITRVGRFMRKHRFDEIPNFINVLKGEMSIIGPRPEQEVFVEQIKKRNQDYIRLQSIKPGITSWGQVKFGYATNIEQMMERLEYDLHYYRNMSILFDLRIALQTIGIIMKGNGI
jgi:lipopolysaccharide/colanic/teichoic acid biosynthesis glycosyltransferase